MKTIHFSIEEFNKRGGIGKCKCVERNGNAIRIICTDADCGQVVVGLTNDGIIRRWNADGSWLYNGKTEHDLLIVDETEPKLREWKPEEVPFGCWIREKNNPKNITMVTAIYKGAVKIGLVGLNDLDIYPMHEKAEYSADNGATWKPCGVLE